jgi:hypothetical protein
LSALVAKIGIIFVYDWREELSLLASRPSVS